MQQNNIGQMFDIDYLLWLTLTMRALLYQYSSSEDDFTVEGCSTIFQLANMTSAGWQDVIELLWMSFKAQLLHAKQYEYMLVVSKYKLVKQRPLTPKIAVKAGAEVPFKQKASPAA